MTLKVSKIEDEFLDKLFEECMSELKEFFKIDWRENRPSIVILENRATID